MTCDPVQNKVHTDIDIDPETRLHYTICTPNTVEPTGFEYVRANILGSNDRLLEKGRDENMVYVLKSKKKRDNCTANRGKRTVERALLLLAPTRRDVLRLSESTTLKILFQRRPM
jgi:hypothetical protein